MKKGCLLCVCMALCLAGCGKTQEPPAETEAPARVITITPAPGSLEPATGPEDVSVSGRGDGTKAQVAYNTTEETASWQVESWEIYPSWAAAGVDTTELIVSGAALEDALPLEDGSGVLIARMECANETVHTEGEAWCYAGELRPAVDGETAGSEVVWFPERGQDVIDGGPWGTAFYIPAEGESAVLTLGWTLTPEAVTAARSGTLCLLCDDGWSRTSLPLIPA